MKDEEGIMRDTGSEVRKLCAILLLCIVLSGCFNQKKVTVDPCAKAHKVCWGQVGTTPADNPYCKELVNCFDWEMKVK